QGVVYRTINEWLADTGYQTICLASVNTTEAIKREAASIAKSMHGHPYAIWDGKKWLSKNSKDKHYCSQLVWVSYYEASRKKIDLDRNGGPAVFPDDIWFHSAVIRPGPVIHGLWARPAEVSPGSTSTITVLASDPDNYPRPITYKWSSRSGRLSGTSGPDPKTWTAPNRLGTYTVTVTVTDSDSRRTPVSKSVTIIVSSIQSCTYSISPTGQPFPASGGTNSVTVTAGSGCSWTATSNAKWITITSGNSGSGDGTVNYSVAANSSTSSRTGTMTIAGQTFTVTQNGTVPTRTLTVASSNPNSGVTITVSPNDNNGQGNGTTQFTRTYNNNTTVMLTAPSSAGGNTFQKWQRNGSDYSTSQTVNVTMGANYTMTAVYRASPQLLVDGSQSSIKQQLQTFTLTGSGYTPNGNIRRFVRNPAGVETEISQIQANANGNIASGVWTWTPQCTDATGTYQVWTVDVSSGRQSNTVQEIVTATPSCNPRIDSISPTRVANGTFTMTINGANFDLGAIDQVYQNGNFIGSGAQGCALISRNSTQLVVRQCMNGIQPGTYEVKVRNSNGQLSNGVQFIVTQPQVTMNPSSGAQGTTFVTNGSGFTPNQLVTRYLRKPNGQVVELTPKMSADSNGTLSWSFTSTCTTDIGTSTLWVVDDFTGRSSNEVTQTVTKGSGCP
ncbi:MAG: BACON domain-containing carbohydrate-binding protein, partial [Candidatus Methanomethylicaceae archaeon]